MSENFRPYMTFSFIVSAPETLHPTGMLTAFLFLFCICLLFCMYLCYSTNFMKVIHYYYLQKIFDSVYSLAFLPIRIYN